MSQTIAKLLSRLQPEIDWVSAGGSPSLPDGLNDQGFISLLSVHNGLSAFKGGLRIFGTLSSLLPSIAEWNRDDLWRAEYKGLDHGLYFFGEDVFGNQFGFSAQGTVWRFLSETGDREIIGESCEEWLEKIFANPVEELGLGLLEDWLCERPKLMLSEHLCPKIPFTAKGTKETSNLYVCDRLDSMRFKGNFAYQIRDVKTGGKIDIRVA